MVRMNRSKQIGMRLVFSLVAVFSYLLATACQSEERIRIQQTAKEVRTLTDARTRVVWVQDAVNLNDVFAAGDQLRLMAYDSEDGQGERVLLPGPGSFHKPLFTPDGQAIVYSVIAENRTYMVNWDGTQDRPLTDGMALATWRDPHDGRDWIYVGRDRDDQRGFSFHQMVRIPLEYPGAEENVWDLAPIQIDNVQLSADGRRASGLFPWPDSGVAHLPNQRVQRIGRGCWTGMAPDNSYIMWTFDGSHRNLLMADTRGEDRWDINISRSEAVGGNEVYHPRWSNHPRFMVLTGPYTIRSGGNNIRGGGPDVEIHIGRFDHDLRTIEEWVQVTSNAYANFYPDLWLDVTEPLWSTSPHEEPPPETVRPALDPSAWPESWDLVFLWKNRDAENEGTRPDGGTRRHECVPAGHARYGRHLDMDVRQGHFVAPEAGASFLGAARASGEWTIEAVVTPTGNADEEAVLLALGHPISEARLALIMVGSELYFVRRDAERVRLGALTPDQPQHLLVRSASDRLVFHLNGEETASFEAMPVDLAGTPVAPLYFGGVPEEAHNWSGYLEGIAMYGRALSAEETRLNAVAYARLLEKRTPPETVTVNARLTHASQIPTPEAIEPYVRGLVANEYEVLEVFDGEFSDRGILVAHWVILDGQTLDTAQREAGAVYTMTLELYDDRPELEGERLSMDTDNLLLRTFFDTDS